MSCKWLRARNMGREFFELVRGRRIESEDWKHLTRTLKRRLADRERGKR
jgi:hypothetical protein